MCCFINRGRQKDSEVKQPYRDSLALCKALNIKLCKQREEAAKKVTS